MDFKREQAARNSVLQESKMDIEREKLASQREIANTQLEIARENKNKYDVQSDAKKDDKEKKD